MLLKNKIEIKAWLKKYKIINYELIEDEKYGYVVNVNDNVKFKTNELKIIEVKFNMVKGFFYCGFNKLISLEENTDKSVGCPEIVKGSFYCNNNELKSLKGCPKSVKEFFCNNNQLISLDGVPEIIKSNLMCNNNDLTINELFKFNKVKGFINLKENKNLGELQNITNFNELKNILNIIKEKTDLSMAVEKTDFMSTIITNKSVVEKQNLELLTNNNENKIIKI